MSWSKCYALRSYLTASNWIVPVLALILEQLTLRVTISLEPRLTWIPTWPLGKSGTLAALQTIISLTTAFIVFTFGSMLVAIQIAGGQLTPRVIATTLLRDNVIRFTTGLFIFSLLSAIGTVSQVESELLRPLMWICAALGMGSLAAFLYLIDHAAPSPCAR